MLARLCRRCKVRRTHRLRLRGISDRLTRRRWFRFGFMFRPRETGQCRLHVPSLGHR